MEKVTSVPIFMVRASEAYERMFDGTKICLPNRVWNRAYFNDETDCRSL